MKIETVLFDFDYTLADSSKGIIECIAYALEGLGLPPVSDQLARQTIGLPLPETLMHLHGPQDQANYQRFSELFIAHADEIMVGKTLLLPGVVETVRAIKESGRKVGIVSTKFRYRIQWILEPTGLLKVFDTIVGGEDVKEHKPEPSGLALAMKQLGATAETTVYVGDSTTDAEVAQRAGVAFVGVLTGVTTADTLKLYGPKAILANVTELPAWLASS